MAGSLAYVFLLLGMTLGALRPVLGLGVLVAVVAVTPSLPWQLGLENLAYPLFYSAGLIGGGWLSNRAGTMRALAHARGVPEPRATDSSGVHAATATVLCLLAAGALALVRSVPSGLTTLGSVLGDAARSLAAFNPGGLAGFIQALMIPLVGVLLFRMATTSFESRSARRRFERAFIAGALLTALSPILQVIALDPTVRPDKGLDESAGLVGFFQDPHSFAAYLVLAIGVLLGIAFERRQQADSGARREGLPVLGVVLMLWIVLLFTNSRTGLLASIVTLGIFAVTHWALGPVDLARRRVRLRALAVGVLVAALVGVAATVSMPVRGALYRGLSGLGNERMWEVLNPEGPEHPLLARRWVQWRKAAHLVRQQPLWGVGPQGYVDLGFDHPELTHLLQEFGDRYGKEELELALVELPAENAHSYFLQYAAEFGLPALAALAWLIGSTVVVTVRGVRVRGAPGRALLFGILAGEAGFLTISLVSHPLLLAEMQALFWTVAAFGVAVAHEATRAAPD